MPLQDDIKFGIVLRVKGGRKAAGKLRLRQRKGSIPAVGELLVL